MTIANVALSNTFNEFRSTTNLVIDEVNKLSDGTATLVIDSITANNFVGVSSDITISGNTGSDIVSFATETLRIVGTNGVSTSVASSSNTININLDTTGVSSGTYGSASQIPVLIFDAQGRVTSASNVNISNISISGNTGSDNITIATETLAVVGVNGISTSVTSNTINVNLDASGVSAGTYGSASKVPILVIDTQGRITSASNVNVAGVSAFNYHSGNANFQISTADGGSFTASIGQHLGTTANVTFQDMVISGNLTVSGTTTTISANNLSVTDNLIYLNDDSSNTNVDLGFAGNYNDGVYRHAGLFRDADDGIWKFFDRYTPEPDASANLDTSHASFTFADLKAGNITSNGAFSGAGSGLTSLNASNISSGTLNAARLATSGVSAGTYGSASAVPQIVVDTYGRATSVSNVAIAISSSAVSGLASSATTDATNASNISSGTLANARTTASSSNGASTIVSRDASGSFAANQITATTLIGSGASITNLSGNNISSGTVAVARGGTGLGSGTSGGILYFSGTGTIASSALLTSNQMVIGGGAGNAPSTSDTLTVVSAVTSAKLYVRATAFAETLVALGNTGTAINLDIVDGGVFTATLTGNATITLRYPVATGVSSFTLILTNDGTAGRSVSWAGGTFRWPNGAASLNRTTAANAIDIWTFFTPDGGTTYYGNIAMRNMSA